VETANKDWEGCLFPSANNPLACLDRGRGLAKRKKDYVQLMALAENKRRPWWRTRKRILGLRHQMDVPPK